MFYCNLDSGMAIDPSAHQMRYKGKLWLVNHRRNVRLRGVVQHRVRQGQMTATFYVDCLGLQCVTVDVEE